MKKSISLFTLLALFSCKSKDSVPENDFQYDEKIPATELGRQLFEGRGNCYACHQPEQKIVGPSLREIASVYRAKNGDIVKFLKEEADPIVDPSQYAAMKINFAVTKTLSDPELEALQAYIYSFSE